MLNLPIMGYIYNPTTYDKLYNPGIGEGAIILVTSSTSQAPSQTPDPDLSGVIS